MFKWLETRLFADEDSRRLQQFAQKIYASIVAQARQSVFYRQYDIKDTVPGRFEMIALHMFLALDSLREDEQGEAEAGGGGEEESEAQLVAQQLVNVMFDDMDDVARELGISDMGVGPKIRKLERSFRSRLRSYHNAMQAPEDDALALTLQDILFDGDAAKKASAEAFAHYIRREHDNLGEMSVEDMVRAKPLFGAPNGDEG